MFADIDKTIALIHSDIGAPNFMLALVLCSYAEFWGKLMLPSQDSKKCFEAFFRKLGTKYVEWNGMEWDKTIKVWDLNTGRLLNTLEGHSDYVYSVAISSDNSKIVSGSLDKTIKVWDLNTGRLLNILEGHSDNVTSVAISSDNSKIVSGSLDKTIKVWDLNTGRLLSTLEGHSSHVNSVAITSDNSKIVSGSYDKIIKVWNRDNGKCYLRCKFDESMESIALSKNRNFVALGGEGGVLYLGSLSS